MSWQVILLNIHSKFLVQFIHDDAGLIYSKIVLLKRVAQSKLPKESDESPHKLAYF